MPNNTEHNKLQLYLDGKLQGEELHEFEKQMIEDEMMNDAVEGLQNISNKKNINEYVNDLNKELHNYTNSKKQRRLQKNLQPNYWSIVAIVLIITLCCIAYYVINQNKN